MTGQHLFGALLLHPSHIFFFAEFLIFFFQEAECEKASMDVKYNMDTKVEDNTRLYKLQKSNFDREINTAVMIA